jgi:hypothetical protein
LILFLCSILLRTGWFDWFGWLLTIGLLSLKLTNSISNKRLSDRFSKRALSRKPPNEGLLGVIMLVTIASFLKTDGPPCLAVAAAVERGHSAI